MRILCPEPQNYSHAGLELVRRYGEVVAEPMGQAAFDARVPDFDAVMVRLQTRVDAHVFEASSRLKAILTPTTGLNHIDLDAAERAGVQVFHLRGETEFLRTITSTAEHTWGLLLALVRNVPRAHDAVLGGQWVQRPFRGNELKGKRLGIVGHGRLGSIVGRYGEAFGMRVLAYDPYVDDLPAYVEPQPSLDALVERADVLSIHVPLNETTVHLIGAAELDRLPAGAFVVNTARGEILDEVALVERLRSGAVAGAAVDVIANEHRVGVDSHPLIEYANAGGNVLITPHIGGAAEEAIAQTDAFIARKWIAAFGLQPIR